MDNYIGENQIHSLIELFLIALETAFIPAIVWSFLSQKLLNRFHFSLMNLDAVFQSEMTL